MAPCTGASGGATARPSAKVATGATIATSHQARRPAGFSGAG
jgi:hypothetical protein